MEVRFTPDLEARLTDQASRQQLSTGEVVQNVVARYFAEEDSFVAAVKRGAAALDRGEFLPHEQAGERLRRFLKP